MRTEPASAAGAGTSRSAIAVGSPYRSRTYPRTTTPVLWLEVLAEPFDSHSARLLGGFQVHGVVGAFDLHQTLGPSGASEGGADRFGWSDRIALGQEHQQRARCNQVDGPGRRIFQDRLEGAHGDFVPPGRRDRRLSLVGELVAFRVGLEREALTG